MLVISLILSLLLLMVVNSIAHFHRVRLDVLAGLCFGLPVLMICLGLVFPPFVLQSAGIFLVSCFWVSRPPPAKGYGRWTCLVTIAAYLTLYVTSVVPTQREYARLRILNPLEDITKRVQPPTTPVAQAATPEIRTRIDLQELNADLRGQIYRTQALQALHEQTTLLFVNSPGFGLSRITRAPSDSQIMLDEIDPVRQPGPRPGSAGDQFPDPAQFSPGIRDLHRKSFLDFVYPAGWGYIKDRKHVAGFVPHRMSKSPGNADDWSLQTLDLVGLLMHDKPVAYVSEHLPRMDQLKTAPTRDLDPFETAGLDALRKGEDLYARQNATTLRMLGAIRAVDQCTICHACDRGELLGAFSYTLGRVKP